MPSKPAKLLYLNEEALYSSLRGVNELTSGDPDPRADPRRTRFLEPRRTCFARRRAEAVRNR